MKEISAEARSTVGRGQYKRRVTKLNKNTGKWRRRERFRVKRPSRNREREKGKEPRKQGFTKK